MNRRVTRVRMKSVPPRGSGWSVSLKGCSDSSRWSQRSEDHRNEASSSPAPRRGATVFCHPFRVWNYFRLLSGGLRYAATTGYYLTALQAEPTRYLAPVPYRLAVIQTFLNSLDRSQSSSYNPPSILRTQ